MRLLGLATSGPFPSVGLRLADGTVVERALEPGADRGKGLLPAVDALLASAGLGIDAIEGLAVDVGPGSFTGARIGVAFAKGLAFARALPVVGVTSLEALAHAAATSPRRPRAPLLPLRDARNGEAYFALYDLPEGVAAGDPPAAPRRIAKPARGPAAAVAACLDERGIARVVALGEDAERLGVALGLASRFAGVRTEAVAVASVLALASPRFRSGATDDADLLAPHYLQPSSPEAKAARASEGAEGRPA